MLLALLDLDDSDPRPAGTAAITASTFCQPRKGENREGAELTVFEEPRSCSGPGAENPVDLESIS